KLWLLLRQQIPLPSVTFCIPSTPNRKPQLNPNRAHTPPAPSAIMSSSPAATLELRELGNTGLKVSCIGFGASPLGNVFGPVSDDDAVAAAVREAFSLGINFFDTSPYVKSNPILVCCLNFLDCVLDMMKVRFDPFDDVCGGYYGGTLSEKVLEKCLKALEVPRSEYIVATKCGLYVEGFDFSSERVIRSIGESLARLQLDYVDIFHCHDIEFASLDQVIAYDSKRDNSCALEIKKSGKARFIGITGLPLNIFTYVLDRVSPGTVDVILSYCHYSINDSALE
ncbi:L-galactose dehydrogenase-like protein, partial [Drosera capensis]